MQLNNPSLTRHHTNLFACISINAQNFFELARKLISGLFTLFIFLLIVSGNSLAQSNNSDDCGDASSAPGDDKFIGVCNLQNTINGMVNSPFTYDDNYSAQGDIDFSIRSCGIGGFFQDNCAEPVSYQVEVQGGDVSGNAFILTEPASGFTIPVTLTFSHSNGSSEQLLPNQLSSSTFSGSASQVATALLVSLTNIDPSLPPGTYSGDFDFTLEQVQHCKWFFIFQNCSDTYLSAIPFSISLTVEPKIRISGLDDMPITANLSGLTQQQQDFCVYSQGGAAFGITAVSGNGSGNFLLTGIDTVEYETWVESLTAGGQVQLTEGQPSGQSWPAHLQDSCPGGENMRLDIRIQQSALSNAMDNSYTDTLTLTVTLD